MTRGKLNRLANLANELNKTIEELDPFAECDEMSCAISELSGVMAASRILGISFEFDLKENKYKCYYNAKQ